RNIYKIMKIKKLEFETSKGKFVVEEASDKNLGRVLLKHITEEQASDIVDTFFGTFYTFDGWGASEDAKLTLECLIKSKGWYLFDNPYKDWLNTDDYDEAEQKTFYNPVIFKIKYK